MVIGKDNIELLKEQIENSYIHDSIIVLNKYDWESEQLCVKLENQYFRESYVIIFDHIQFYLSIQGKWGGERSTVHSLTIEDAQSLYKWWKNDNVKMLDNMIYVCIQTFSGEELHIVSEQVSFERV